MQYIVYRCDLTLHDYLFFASTERGKVAETSPFIHNYALTYALDWAPRRWYNNVQRPHYHDDLSPIGNRYITPARLMKGGSVVVQYNTLSERLRTEKQQSVGYPDWGFIKCFRPETLFRAYTISQEQIRFPGYIRLGKFLAKAKMHSVSAKRISQVQGNCKTAHLLNWSDLKRKPVAFNILTTSLPSRLVNNAFFENGVFLHANFADGDEIKLPLDMGYLLGV